MFYLVDMCCRDSIITPSTLGLVMAFASPYSLYHTFWLVVNLTSLFIISYLSILVSC